MPPNECPEQEPSTENDSVDGEWGTEHRPRETRSSNEDQPSSYDYTMNSGTQECENLGASDFYVTQQTVPRSLDMKKEVDRYETFTSQQWPWPGCVSPRDLARAGFYYKGHSDRVRCAFCQNDVGQWDEGDEPLQEHRRHFPFCRFIRGINVGNIPRPGTDNPVEYVSDEAGHDVCGISPRVSTNVEITLSILPIGSKVNKGADLEKLGVVKTQTPVSPHLLTKEARLETFKYWPRSLKQTPNNLAEAGFYYTGNGDRVKCFHCNGGLNDWEENDDPWIEHAKWFSRCSFVIQIRGQKFVDQAVKMRNSICRPQGDEGMAEVTEEETMDVEVNEDSNVTQQPNSRRNSNNKSISDSTSEVCLCRLCMQKKSDTVFLPCGHLVSCSKCGSQVVGCPVCRVAIQATVPVFVC